MEIHKIGKWRFMSVKPFWFCLFPKLYSKVTGEFGVFKVYRWLFYVFWKEKEKR